MTEYTRTIRVGSQVRVRDEDGEVAFDIVDPADR